MNKSDFFYHLPDELIAQTPVYPRDSSKLLVYNKNQNTISDKHFYDIVDYLHEGDVLVLNNTKVLPVRLYGERDVTKGKIEFLLHKRLDLKRWEVLVKPGKMAKVGVKFNFSPELSATVIAVLSDGTRIVEFDYQGVFEEILQKVGEMPLPHYIHERLEDSQRYNTVYSKYDGSSAAPTAGLHFTQELLEKILNKGVKLVYVLLHVGLGTFRPVKEENILNHEMHSEYYELSKQSAEILKSAKQQGNRIIAVGTTSVRVLESVYGKYNDFVPCFGYTNIFIYPPYQFKAVDALVTNFHLPESTLIMLVSALIGRENTLNIYKHAVDMKYRFFSFGDSCLLL